MLIVPTKIFVSLGAGAILVVLVAVISALTLLPAVLGLLGDRVESCGCRIFGRRAQKTTAPHEGFWGRTVDLVMRHRVIAVVGSVAVLLICAIPYININTGAAGLSTLPDSTLAKQGYVALNRDFTVGEVTPATIVVDGDVATPAAAQAFRNLKTSLARGRPLRAGGACRCTVQEPGRDHRPCGRRSQLRRCVERRSRLAQPLSTGRAGGQRSAGVRHRRQRAEPRLLRHHRHLPADRVRAGARPQLHPADARLPLDRRAGVEHRHEPALRRRRLWAARPGHPGGPWRRSVRLPRRSHRRGLDPAVPFLGAVRTVHGLPGVPALAHPRALRPARQHHAKRSPTASPPPPG